MLHVSFVRTTCLVGTNLISAFRAPEVGRIARARRAFDPQRFINADFLPIVNTTSGPWHVSPRLAKLGCVGLIFYRASVVGSISHPKKSESDSKPFLPFVFEVRNAANYL